MAKETVPLWKQMGFGSAAAYAAEIKRKAKGGIALQRPEEAKRFAQENPMMFKEAPAKRASGAEASAKPTSKKSTAPQKMETMEEKRRKAKNRAAGQAKQKKTSQADIARKAREMKAR